MKKLFSISGSLVLSLLISLSALLYFPAPHYVAGVGVLLGLLVVGTTSLGATFLVRPAVMQNVDSFSIPTWWSAYFLLLLFFAVASMYAGYQMQLTALYADTVISCRFLSVVMLGSVLVSFFHWQVKKVSFYHQWRSQSAESTSNDQEKLHSVEAREGI